MQLVQRTRVKKVVAGEKTAVVGVVVVVVGVAAGIAAGMQFLRVVAERVQPWSVLLKRDEDDHSKMLLLLLWLLMLM